MKVLYFPMCLDLNVMEEIFLNIYLHEEPQPISVIVYD